MRTRLLLLPLTTLTSVLLFSCKDNKGKDIKQTVTKESVQTSRTETDDKKTAFLGTIIGDVNNLDMIGVRHTTKPGFAGTQLSQEIESLFALQNNQRILIIDGVNPKDKYGKIFQKRNPKGWITEKVVQTHSIFQVIDVRPRTSEYKQVLYSFMKEVDSLTREGKITYSVEYREGLPVYKVNETSPRVSSVENIAYVLREEKSFQDDLNLRITSTSDYQNMEYLVFAGAIHVYRVWLETQVENVYFGLDNTQLHDVARMVAIQKWFEKQYL